MFISSPNVIMEKSWVTSGSSQRRAGRCHGQSDQQRVGVSITVGPQLQISRTAGTFNELSNANRLGDVAVVGRHWMVGSAAGWRRQNRRTVDPQYSRSADQIRL